MPKAILRGFVVLTLAVIVGGCTRGGTANVEEKAEDKLTKQQIEILNNMAAEFEKVTNKESMAQIQPEVRALSEQLSKITQEFQALPVENREAAMHTHQVSFEEAVTRMKAAKQNANKAAIKS